MKLTGTNRSIGLIVPIACAHLSANAKRLSDTRRRQRLRPNGEPSKRRVHISANAKRLSDKTNTRVSALVTSFSYRFCTLAGAKSCPLPTWWLLRGGRTRSHSEHGRETPQRRWYFVLRRGRVGRCQVCKRQE